MSELAGKTHGKIRTAHQNVLKFKGEGEMKIATQITKAKMLISRGLATQHPAKLVGILALGALMIAGTAVQFVPEPADGSASHATAEEARDLSKSTNVGAADTEYRFMDLEDEPLSVQDLLTYVYPEEAAQIKAPANNINSEYRFMDLEDEPLSVQDLLTYVYPEEADPEG